MPKDLSSNRPSGINLNNQMNHLKGRPMTMLDQVVDQSFVVEVRGLISWVTNPSHVDKEVLCVWCPSNQLASH